METAPWCRWPTSNINLAGGTIDMQGHDIASHPVLITTNINLSGGSVNNAATIAGLNITIAAGVNIAVAWNFELANGGNSACRSSPLTLVSGGGLGAYLMPRLAYRNFGDHDSVVGNHAVSANGVAGIRWFELRNVTNGPVTVYQESTYQPDTTWRWTGSIAMDQAGNLRSRI